MDPSNTPPSSSPGNGSSPESGQGQSVDLASLKAQLDRLLPLAEALPKLEGRISELGRDLGKVRGKVKQAQPADSGQGDPGSAPVDDVHALVKSAVTYGAIKTKLPEAAAKILDAHESEGASYTELLRAAELAHTMFSAVNAGKSSAAGDPPAVPTGAAATSAPRTSPAHPRTLAEYAALAKSDPARKAALDADPTFHPDELPRR